MEYTMTAVEFRKYQESCDSRLMDYFGDWSVVTELKEGDEISLPANSIAPRTRIEWDSAKVGGTFSQDRMIEVEQRGDILCVFDGHNRLKDALSKDENKIIRVKFVGKSNF